MADFAWPRDVVLPKVSCALVATFHDFNWRHSFGNFSSAEKVLVDVETEQWLRGDVQPISSTRFIAEMTEATHAQCGISGSGSEVLSKQGAPSLDEPLPMADPIRTEDIGHLCLEADTHAGVGLPSGCQTIR